MLTLVFSNLNFLYNLETYLKTSSILLVLVTLSLILATSKVFLSKIRPMTTSQLKPANQVVTKAHVNGNLSQKTMSSKVDDALISSNRKSVKFNNSVTSDDGEEKSLNAATCPFSQMAEEYKSKRKNFFAEAEDKRAERYRNYFDTKFAKTIERQQKILTDASLKNQLKQQTFPPMPHNHKPLHEINANEAGRTGETPIDFSKCIFTQIMEDARNKRNAENTKIEDKQNETDTKDDENNQNSDEFVEDQKESLAEPSALKPPPLSLHKDKPNQEQIKETEISLEEESEIRKKQLAKIFSLLKEQEAMFAKGKTNGNVTHHNEENATNDTSVSSKHNDDDKFKVLKEDGTYEDESSSEISFEEDFKEQIKLYGL